LAGQSFKPSDNDYDWLGPGIYFWEANPERGLDFAREAASRKKSSIKKPAVVGAVLDLGLCLDLTTLAAAELIKEAHADLMATITLSGVSAPQNRPDLRLRRLDCAVIRRLHELLKAREVEVDTVRGVFLEGDPIYPTSGFYLKTHSQIAVRNTACIKGVFRVDAAQLPHSHSA
jgi:hypothetical protein